VLAYLCRMNKDLAGLLVPDYILADF